MTTAIRIRGRLPVAGMQRAHEPRRLDNLRRIASTVFVRLQWQAPAYGRYQTVAGGFAASFFRNGIALPSTGFGQRISFVDTTPELLDAQRPAKGPGRTRL